MDRDLELRLIAGKSIPFQNGKIYQLKLDEIIDMGWDTFDKICLPYIVTKEFLKIPDDEKFKDIKVFDVLIMKGFKINDDIMSDLLFNSLSIFFKSNNITINQDDVENPQIVINNNEVFIDRYNFKDLQNIIIEIYNLHVMEKVAETKTFKNERLARIQQKLEEGRRKAADNKGNEICMIYNYLTHSQEFIDYKSILDMTLYQFINSYKLLLKKEQYKNNISIRIAALSQGAEIEDELEHWIIKN